VQYPTVCPEVYPGKIITVTTTRPELPAELYVGQHDDEKQRSSSEADRLAIIDQVASRNVVRTVAEVIAMSPAIGELLASTQIGIVGMMYDVGSGTVRVIEETLLGLAGTSQDKNQL